MPVRSVRAWTLGAALVLTVGGLGSASTLVQPAGDGPADVGRWLAPFEGQEPAVNMALLHDGRVLYYSGIEADESNTNPDALHFIWGAEPLYGLSRVLDINGYNGDGTVDFSVATPSPPHGGAFDLFCSGTTVRPDGSVLAAGASIWYTLDDSLDADADGFNTPLKGGNQTRVYDAATNTWSDGGDMAVGRWYPSAITLADGDGLVASGIQTLFWANTHNTLIEVNDGSGWDPLATRLELSDGVEVEEGGRVSDVTGPTPVEPVGETTTTPVHLPLYPRLFQLPNDDVFYSTVGTLWGPFGERPEEALYSIQQVLDIPSGRWSLLGPSVYGARQHAAVVPLLLDPADDYTVRLLTFGGTLQRSVLATNVAELATVTIDANGDAGVNNEETAPLNNARWHPNGVLLPDGTVAAVGGAEYDNVMLHGGETQGVKQLEIYDPATDTWSVMATQGLERGYHSTAILLPDGRILSGGHVPLPHFHRIQREHIEPQEVETRFEVYEPPYLFLDDDRPVIDAVDTEWDYDVETEITVSGLDGGAADVHSVVLIRPGATTHAFDADQRGIILDGVALDNGDGTVRFIAKTPEKAAIAPPGYYMLFVNEDVGGKAVPSVATFVHIG